MTPIEYLKSLRDRRGLPSIGPAASCGGFDCDTGPTIIGASFGERLRGPCGDEPEQWAEGSYCVAMPGATALYQKSLRIVTVEELDEGGDVLRSSRIGLARGGKLPWNVKKVRDVVGKVAAPRRAVVKPPVAPIAAPVAHEAPAVAPSPSQMESAPMSDAFAALCTAAPSCAAPPAAPAPVAASDEVAALRAAVDALLGRVAALEAGQPVVMASRAPRHVRERMVRAYLRVRAERTRAALEYATLWQQQSALVEELEAERTEARELARQMSSLARELAEAREALARSEEERLAFAHDTGAMADELRVDLERAHEETARAVDRAALADGARVAAEEKAARMEARANALEAAQAAFAARPASPLPVVDLPATSAIILPLRASSRRA